MKVAKNTRVAFQGERGAFSEEATVKLLGSEVALVPLPTFEAAFGAIAEGKADYILAPIENSLAGPVYRSFDLLVEGPLTIGARIIPIVHSLIGPPGGRFEEVAIVESHPVALAQCERFFSAHPLLKRIATDDTAGSVREIVQAGDRKRAAIASKRAAEFMAGKFFASIWKMILKITRGFRCLLRRLRSRQRVRTNFRWFSGWSIFRGRCFRRWSLSRAEKLI